MNPYVLLAAGVLWAASLAATGWWMYGAGEDHTIARLAQENDIEERATAAAADAAASAISRIEVKHVLNRQVLETQVREVPVFRDCRAPDDSMQRLNAALTGADAASAPSVVPATSAPR